MNYFRWSHDVYLNGAFARIALMINRRYQIMFDHIGQMASRWLQTNQTIGWMTFSECVKTLSLTLKAPGRKWKQYLHKQHTVYYDLPACIDCVKHSVYKSGNTHLFNCRNETTGWVHYSQQSLTFVEKLDVFTTNAATYSVDRLHALEICVMSHSDHRAEHDKGGGHHWDLKMSK